MQISGNFNLSGGLVVVPPAPTGNATVAVTWVYPQQNQTFLLIPNVAITPIQSVAITYDGDSYTYSANTIPTGLTLAANGLITGTPTVIGNTSTNLSVSTGSGVKSSVYPNFTVAYSVPGAPTIGTASAINSSSASVTYTAPANNGGATITKYVATSSPGAITATVSQAGSGTITVTGLSAGSSYTFTVTAINTAGAGGASSPSNSITPPTPMGTLYGWGANYCGQLGLGYANSQVVTPAAVGGLTAWTNIFVGCGPGGFATKNDGTLWVWGGNNYYGRLGLSLSGPSNTAFSSPQQVGSLTNWKTVAPDALSTVAVKTDGTLWSWGFGGYGQLGISNTTSYSSPKQVGALTNWSTVSSGNNSTLAIKIDGSLWAWGSNTGMLGLGNLTSYSSPVQVGALTNWQSISLSGNMAAAVKTDNTLWVWGGNGYGGLGLGNTTSYSSPKQVGTLTNWLTVSAGNAYSGLLGVKTDGTLWAAGYNGFGALGLGGSTNYSSPKQVGALTNWLLPSNSGGPDVAAIKTDGTLWTWGYNAYGEAGDGSYNVYHRTPVQVTGSYTTWFKVAVGAYFVMGIHS